MQCPFTGTEKSRRDREDRDNRDGVHSRHRDSSRSKRETSSSRRDRDRDDDDDGRHWRDDGKRDERMAARRDRERARVQERESDDRRWPPGEDRDGGRYKRNVGRERKMVGTVDEPKEKDDRKKEKEPAWMDTYIPNESTSGILGGQDPNGELDGIQAWKKGLREKDTRDKEASATTVRLSKSLAEPVSDLTDKPLDEIQIFRLLMKKEEDKKRLDENAAAFASESALVPSSHDDEGIFQPTGILFTLLPHVDLKLTTTADLAVNLTTVQSKSSLSSLPSSASIHASPIPPFSLKDPAVLTSVKLNQDLLPDRESPIPEATNVTVPKPPSELATFPPVGSRVLAMKNRTAANANSTSNLQTLNGEYLRIKWFCFLKLLLSAGLPSTMPESIQTFSKNEPLRSHGTFSPFDDSSRPSYVVDDSRDLANQGTGSQRLPVDQLFSTGMNSQNEANFNSSLSKGSRLAKIFENKSRDMPTVISQSSLPTS